MILFSRRPRHLGLCFRLRECIRGDLKASHLLHSPAVIFVSQPSPFTKHQFLRTLSHRYLPFGVVGVCLTAAAVFVFVHCYVCGGVKVHLSIRIRDYICINVCVCSEG